MSPRNCRSMIASDAFRDDAPRLPTVIKMKTCFLLGLLALPALAQILPTVAVSLKNFGAVGDGITDDTAAIQKAFNWATQTTNGKRLLCNDGRYLLSSTITIQNVNGLAFVGQGSCMFGWAGISTSPMFDLQDVAYSRFEGFQIIGNRSHPLAEGMRIENGNAHSVTPSMDEFVNIFIYGINGYINYGFRIPIGPGGDNNNDFHLFENVHVNNYAVSAWSLEATQAHFIHFLNDYCLSGGTGQTCISGGSADYGAATSFIWDGGFSGQNTAADFLLKCNVAQQPYVIRNMSSEASYRFIDFQSNCGASSPLSIEAVRWSDTGLAPDGIAIRFEDPGPITIKDSKIGDTYKSPVKIYWNYVGGFAPPSFVLLTTNIMGTLSTTQSIFPGVHPTYVIGSYAVNSETSYKALSAQ